MTRFTRLRLALPSWLRLPRRTARLRLTLLYSALFLVSGAILLAITYLLFGRAIVQQQRGHLPIATTVSPQQTHVTLSSALQKAMAAQAAADKHHLLVNSGIALAIVTVLALVLGWLFAGRVLQPVRVITATARRISTSNLHQRLALHSTDDEFKKLADTLDDLFARLAAAFEAQRHFVANASHELRTPLTAERTLVQVALANPTTTADRWRSTGQELLASSQEQERLIEALLALASSEAGLDHHERIDLSILCEHVLRRPHPDIDTLDLQVETTIYPAPIDGDPRLIERLLANLIENAAGHNIPGGRIRISTTVTDNHAVLSVTNTGPVIPRDDIDRLFQPFQRLNHTRAHHKDGHGLGLSIVQAIAEAHGAAITACPARGGGLSIDVAFPTPTEATGPTTPRRQRANPDHREAASLATSRRS